jgi:hypothetical protein
MDEEPTVLDRYGRTLDLLLAGGDVPTLEGLAVRDAIEQAILHEASAMEDYLRAADDYFKALARQQALDQTEPSDLELDSGSSKDDLLDAFRDETRLLRDKMHALLSGAKPHRERIRVLRAIARSAEGVR